MPLVPTWLVAIETQLDKSVLDSNRQDRPALPAATMLKPVAPDRLTAIGDITEPYSKAPISAARPAGREKPR